MREPLRGLPPFKWGFSFLNGKVIAAPSRESNGVDYDQSADKKTLKLDIFCCLRLKLLASVRLDLSLDIAGLGCVFQLLPCLLC